MGGDARDRHRRRGTRARPASPDGSDRRRGTGCSARTTSWAPALRRVTDGGDAGAEAHLRRPRALPVSASFLPLGGRRGANPTAAETIAALGERVARVAMESPRLFRRPRRDGSGSTADPNRSRVRDGEHGVPSRRVSPARFASLRGIQRRVSGRTCLHAAPLRAVRRSAGDGAVQARTRTRHVSPDHHGAARCAAGQLPRMGRHARRRRSSRSSTGARCRPGRSSRSSETPSRQPASPRSLPIRPSCPSTAACSWQRSPDRPRVSSRAAERHRRAA